MTYIGVDEGYELLLVAFATRTKHDIEDAKKMKARGQKYIRCGGDNEKQNLDEYIRDAEEAMEALRQMLYTAQMPTKRW